MVDDCVTAQLWPKSPEDAKTVFKRLHEMGIAGIDAHSISPITARFNPKAEPFQSKGGETALQGEVGELCEFILICD